MNAPQQSTYLDNPRREVVPFVPRAARSALDVGCGRGGFGKTLRELLGDDARIVGADASADNVAAAADGHGYDEVLLGYYPDAVRPSDGRFEVVVMLDVLEHMIDPWAALERTHELLEPGGCVVAAIPSIQYFPVVAALLRGRWDYADEGTLDRTHLRFFTRETVVEMFERAGYSVERCEGVNPHSLYRPGERGWRLMLRRARRPLSELRWLPLWRPDSRWVQFIVVARPA